MLLFKPEHVPLIQNGTKTQTRRLWLEKKGPRKGKLKEKPRVKIGSIHLAKTQMLSTDYFAKLKILRTWKEDLGEISQEDVLAEGYKTRDEYITAFFTINKITDDFERMDWLFRKLWCVEFQEIRDEKSIKTIQTTL